MNKVLKLKWGKSLKEESLLKNAFSKSAIKSAQLEK